MPATVPAMNGPLPVSTSVTTPVFVNGTPIHSVPTELANPVTIVTMFDGADMNATSDALNASALASSAPGTTGAPPASAVFDTASKASAQAFAAFTGRCRICENTGEPPTEYTPP